jgi:hypothetical protein
VKSKTAQLHLSYKWSCGSAITAIMYTYFWVEIVAFLASFFEYPAIKTSLPSPTTPPLCVHWIAGNGRQASCTNWRGLRIIYSVMIYILIKLGCLQCWASHFVSNCYKGFSSTCTTDYLVSKGNVPFRTFQNPFKYVTTQGIQNQRFIPTALITLIQSITGTKREVMVTKRFSRALFSNDVSVIIDK